MIWATTDNSISGVSHAWDEHPIYKGIWLSWCGLKTVTGAIQKGDEIRKCGRCLRTRQRPEQV